MAPLGRALKQLCEIGRNRLRPGRVLRAGGARVPFGRPILAVGNAGCAQLAWAWLRSRVGAAGSRARSGWLADRPSGTEPMPWVGGGSLLPHRLRPDTRAGPQAFRATAPDRLSLARLPGHRADSVVAGRPCPTASPPRAPSGPSSRPRRSARVGSLLPTSSIRTPEPGPAGPSGDRARSLLPHRLHPDTRAGPAGPSGRPSRIASLPPDRPATEPIPWPRADHRRSLLPHQLRETRQGPTHRVRGALP